MTREETIARRQLEALAERVNVVASFCNSPFGGSRPPATVSRSAAG